MQRGLELLEDFISHNQPNNTDFWTEQSPAPQKNSLCFLLGGIQISSERLLPILNSDPYVTFEMEGEEKHKHAKDTYMQNMWHVANAITNQSKIQVHWEGTGPRDREPGIS